MTERLEARRSFLHDEIELVFQPSSDLDAILLFEPIWIRVATDNVEHLDWLVITVGLGIREKLPL